MFFEYPFLRAEVFGPDNLLSLNQLLELLSCVSLRFLPGGKFVPAATFPGGRRKEGAKITDSRDHAGRTCEASGDTRPSSRRPKAGDEHVQKKVKKEFYLKD